MTNQNSLLQGGVSVAIDPQGTWQWRLNGEVALRIRRFASFIVECLQRPLDADQSWICHLVTLDGVPASAVTEIEHQNCRPYKFDERLYIEWEGRSPPRTERRMLSKLTADAWMLSRLDPNMGISSRSKLDLESMLKTSPSYQLFKKPTEELERDQLCWWLQCLPAPIFAHLAGLQTISALPRSALARRQVQLVLDPSAAAIVTTDYSADLGLTADLLDASEIANGKDSSNVLIQVARRVFSSASSLVDGVVKRQWALALAELKLRAISEGPRTSILLAWGVHLCETGTVTEPNPAASTVKKYFTQAALPLLDLLRTLPDSFDEEQWQVEAIQDQYRILILGQATGNQKTMTSALVNFHAFLVENFDMDPLPRGLHVDIAEARVKAQVVWQHEVDRVAQWLTQIQDLRLQKASLIMLLIGRECPVRSHELVRLTMANIRCGRLYHRDLIEIEIARDASRGRLKRPASQRRLTVTNQETIQLISHWLAQRKEEGASSKAYLFGDPNDDDLVYRPAATMAVLNQLLKAATGERDISFHTLRHTAISEKLTQCLQSSPLVDINRLALVAVESGHSSLSTTFKSYFHTYEYGLRINLNEGLRRTVDVTSQMAERLVSAKAATIRKRAARCGLGIQEFVWQEFAQGAISQGFDRVEQGFRMCAPIQPIQQHTLPPSITPTVALDALTELMAGASTASVASRFAIPSALFAQSIEKFLTVCHEHGRMAWPGGLGRRMVPPGSVQQALELLRIDLRRARQVKYRALGSFLSNDVERDALRAVIRSWTSVHRGGYLHLDETGLAVDLYRFLNKSGVNPFNLRICIADSRIEGRFSVEVQTLLAVVCNDFANCFGQSPRVSSVQHRPGRPRCYLAWDAPSDFGGNSSEAPPSAGASVAGLHGWMLASQFYCDLLEFKQ